MKFVPYISLSFLLIVLLAACSKPLNIPLPEHEPALTLNTILTADEPVHLYVSRTFGILEVSQSNPEKVVLSDAHVDLYENGTWIDSMKYIEAEVIDTLWAYTSWLNPDSTIYETQLRTGSQYVPYGGPMLAKAGSTYRFEVSHDQYGKASGETRIPTKPDLLNLSVVKDSIVNRDFDDGYRNKFTAFKIRLNDPVGRNAYHVFGELDYTFDVSNIPDTNTVQQFCSTHIVRDFDGISYGESRPIWDDMIEGQTGELVVFFDLPGCCGYPSDFADEPLYDYLSVKTHVFILTEEYAFFQEKHNLQRSNRQDGVDGVFFPSEPVVLPSNVEGGYGMIGSYNLAEIEVEL